MPDVRQRHSSSCGGSQICWVGEAEDSRTVSTQSPPGRGSSRRQSRSQSPASRPPLQRMARRSPQRPVFVCRLRSANRVGTGRSSGPRHAHSSRRPFAWRTPSLHSTPLVLVPPVPPVLHGGSAAPPASPPRGPASELCASPTRLRGTPPRETAPLPLTRIGLPAFNLRAVQGASTSVQGSPCSPTRCPFPNPACSGLRFARR